MRSSTLVARVTSSATSTPGPGAYYPQYKISNKPDAPKYSFQSRHDSKTNSLDVPFNNIPSTIGQGPKISLASRHTENNNEQTPGPSYVPPPLGSDAKKVSMASRHKEIRSLSADNPGPGTYSIPPKFANDAHKFTLHGRTNDQFSFGSQSPGPAAYNPDYMAVKKRAPSATLHIRASYTKGDITPGPGAYQISRDLGGKAATFHSRPVTSMKDTTPGPGAYNPSDATLKVGPKFTFKGRHETSTRPDTAQYRLLPSTIGQGPKISLGSRHAERNSENTPGPSYIPPSFGSNARKSSMGMRHKELRSSSADFPGPGAYSIPERFARDARKSSLHSRTMDSFTIGDVSPGPAQYTPDYSSQKPRAPSATMHIRTKLPQPEQTPGYYDLGSTLKGPSFTIGRREELALISV